MVYQLIIKLEKQYTIIIIFYSALGISSAYASLNKVTLIKKK